MLTIDKLESIFQDFPVPALILAADQNFKILQANQAYLHTLAMSPHDLCGKPIFEVFPDQLPDDPESPIKKILRCIELAIQLKTPQTPGTIPYRIPDEHGGFNLRFWMLDYIPIMDKTGEVAFVLQLTHEIVENQIIDRIQSTTKGVPYERMFDTAQNGFFLADKNGEVLAVNNAACIMFGYSEEEFKRLRRHDLLVTDENMQRLLIRRDAEGKVSGEVIAINKNGTRFPCEYSSVRFITPDGKQRYCTEIIDIRSWKDAEEKMRQSEENLRAIFDHTVEGFVLVDKTLNIIAFNEKAGELILQYIGQKKVTVGTSLLEYLAPDRQIVFRSIAEQVFKGDGIEYERAYPLPDGRVRWFSFAVNPVKENDTTVGLCISGRDITKQKLAEEKLVQSEEKYRKIFDLSPLPIWIYDLDSLCILEVNEAAIKHYGYSRREFLSMTILDVRPPEDAGALMDLLDGIEENREKPVNYWRHVKKNGEIIFVDITGHAINFYGPNARIITCRDVTETIKAEAELLRSNERFREAARASSDAIWDWDLSHDTVFLGEGFSTLFGYSEANNTVPRKWFIDRVHPDERSRIATRVREVINGCRRGRFQDEYRFRRADDSYAIICNSVVIVCDENDKALRVIGAMTDITHQKEEEQHLRQLESVITNTSDAVLVIDVSRQPPRVIYANPAFYKNNGYTPNEIKTHGFALLQGPGTDMAEIAKLEQAIQNGKSCQVQAAFYKKNGERYWASLAISPVTDAKGNVKNYIAIERDITERMNYLTAIEQQNKQLREIAWVQSHKVRAPLASILGLTDLLIEDPNGPHSKETLEMLKKSAEKLDIVIHEIVEKTDDVSQEATR
jgi:PAS domain S-box-containing protein